MTRRTGPSLSERIDTRRDANQITAGRHCWVDEPLDRPGRFPGLLLQWRHDDNGWAGLVAYLLPDVDEQTLLVQRWLPAGHLSART